MALLPMIFLFAGLIVFISHTEAKRTLPSQEWLLKTRNNIENLGNSIENDFSSENFIFDNTDIKPKEKKTSFIESEVREYNEILKPEDARYVDSGESHILNRDIFGYKSKPKPKAVPIIFNTADEYDGSGDNETTVGM